LRQRFLSARLLASFSGPGFGSMAQHPASTTHRNNMIAQCNILSSSAGDTNEHMKPRKFHNAAEKTRYLVQEFCSHPTLRESVQLSFSLRGTLSH
jgi:hypothetical protein